MAKPASIDDYLATLPADQRAALQKLRKAIHAAAPKAEECIRYQRPAFRQGSVLVAFGAAAKHCAFYPMSSATIAAHAAELAGYDTSTGTVRFAADEPLPAALVKKLVQARLAENAARSARSSGKRSAAKDAKTEKSGKTAKTAKKTKTAEAANSSRTAKPVKAATAKSATAKSATAKAANAKTANAKTEAKTANADRTGRRAEPAKSVATVKSTAPASRLDVKPALAAIEALSTQRDRDNLGRFGIVAPKSFGVSMANLKVLAKRLGRGRILAEALWESGWYEARMLATLVDEPAHVTPAQMDRWCRDFDNWAICDTACFALFDRTPHAWGRVAAWRTRAGEFQKRAAFALIASLALHDKKGGDEPFLESLRFVEEAARDERNFVKKGVNWALRAVGRRNPRLNATALLVARRLAESKDATSRWIGKDALREFATVAAKRASKS